MKFSDYLESIELYDGEVYTNDGVESKFSFVWNEYTEFTNFGKEKYAKILDSEIRIDKNNNIVLMREGIYEKELDEFLALCAGYVSCSYYDTCIRELDVVK